MVEGVDDFVGGFLLAWAFLHLVAGTLEPADWARVRTAPRAVLLRAALTFGVALRITGGDDFIHWLTEGTWVIGAGSLLFVPAVAGCFAERWLSICKLKFRRVRDQVGSRPRVSTPARQPVEGHNVG